MRVWAILPLLCVCASAFSQPPSTGLETPWDARQLLAGVVASTGALHPILAAMNPQQWYDQKGAPSTYILQWQSAQEQLRYVETAAKQLAPHVDSLSGNLELYYRIEALESTARSLNEGAERYGDRAEADKLGRWVGAALDARRRLRDYIQDLATSLEQNYKIADEEAQRCRGIITKTPAPTGKRPATK